MATNNESPTPTGSPARGRHLKTAVIVALAVLLGLALVGLKFFRAGDAPNTQATFAARRGPLTISVLESGTIKARDQIIIKNEVEGRRTILTIIPEGTHVKKGDLLVELDASSLEDTKVDQEIRVQNAEAAYINAKENLAVVQNQAQSDTDKAQLTLEFAVQDLDQYKKGQYPNELSAAQNKITLAQEELTRAQETLKWSQTLYQEKYISQTELQADQLAAKRKALDLELAQNDLDLLQNFTYHRQVAQLESDLSQAKMALERIKRKAKADVVQAEANLKAKQAEYARQQDKLKKIEEQIQKTKIYAPADGLVIYATSAKRGGWRGNVEPLAEGQEVREREELIYLPTSRAALAEVNIHESNVEKITKGLPAIVTVDALPGRKFSGRVERIAPLPNAQSVWMNPDLKVYNTQIYLDNNSAELRTGMSCQVEIIVQQYQDVVYVPLQAVLQVKGTPTVFVVQNGKTTPRRVETGLDNNRMIRIISGLQEGERVLLTPPLEAGAVGTSTGKTGTAPPAAPAASKTTLKATPKTPPKAAPTTAQPAVPKTTPQGSRRPHGTNRKGPGK